MESRAGFGMPPVPLSPVDTDKAACDRSVAERRPNTRAAGERELEPGTPLTGSSESPFGELRARTVGNSPNPAPSAESLSEGLVAIRPGAYSEVALCRLQVLGMRRVRRGCGAGLRAGSVTNSGRGVAPCRTACCRPSGGNGTRPQRPNARSSMVPMAVARGLCRHG